MSQESWRWSRALARSTHTSERSGGASNTRLLTRERTTSTDALSVGDTSTGVGGAYFDHTPLVPAHHSNNPAGNEVGVAGCGLDRVTYRMVPVHHHCREQSVTNTEEEICTYLSVSEASVTVTIFSEDFSLSPSTPDRGGVGGAIFSRFCCCSATGLRV